MGGDEGQLGRETRTSRDGHGSHSGAGRAESTLGDSSSKVEYPPPQRNVCGARVLGIRFWAPRPVHARRHTRCRHSMRPCTDEYVPPSPPSLRPNHDP